MYHYAGNNPVKYTDPDGRVVGVVIGAAVGAVVSGSCELFNQVVIQGKSIDNIDMRKVGIAAGGGAISGAIAGTGVGLVGQIAINSSISALQNAGNQVLDIKDGVQNEFDVVSLAVSTAMGGIAGGTGGAGSNTNKVIDNAAKQLTNKVSKEIKHNGLKGLSSKTTKNAITYFNKNTSKAMVEITNSIPNTAITTISQDGLNKIADDISNRE